MTPVKTAEEVHDQPVRHGYSGAFVFIAEINFIMGITQLQMVVLWRVTF